MPQDLIPIAIIVVALVFGAGVLLYVVTQPAAGGFRRRRK